MRQRPRRHPASRISSRHLRDQPSRATQPATRAEPDELPIEGDWDSATPGLEVELLIITLVVTVVMLVAAAAAEGAARAVSGTIAFSADEQIFEVHGAGGPTQLTHDRIGVVGIAWSPNGHSAARVAVQEDLRGRDPARRRHLRPHARHTRRRRAELVARRNEGRIPAPSGTRRSAISGLRSMLSAPTGAASIGSHRMPCSPSSPSASTGRPTGARSSTAARMRRATGSTRCAQTAQTWRRHDASSPAGRRSSPTRRGHATARGSPSPAARRWHRRRRRQRRRERRCRICPGAGLVARRQPFGLLRPPRELGDHRERIRTSPPAGLHLPQDLARVLTAAHVVGLPDKFDPRKNAGLGLRLAHSLADQIKARLSFNNHRDRPVGDAAHSGVSLASSPPMRGTHHKCRGRRRDSKSRRRPLLSSEPGRRGAAASRWSRHNASRPV